MVSCDQELDTELPQIFDSYYLNLSIQNQDQLHILLLLILFFHMDFHHQNPQRLEDQLKLLQYYRSSHDMCI